MYFAFGQPFAFFVIRLSRGRMTKKWMYSCPYPGLRLLRSLTLGYHMSRLQRWGMEVS
jgi:hypothetical protein